MHRHIVSNKTTFCVCVSSSIIVASVYRNARLVVHHEIFPWPITTQFVSFCTSIVLLLTLQPKQVELCFSWKEKVVVEYQINNQSIKLYRYEGMDHISVSYQNTEICWQID